MVGGGKTLIANLISGLKRDPWIYDANIERICSLNNLKIDLETSADFLQKNLNENILIIIS